MAAAGATAVDKQGGRQRGGGASHQSPPSSTWTRFLHNRWVELKHAPETLWKAVRVPMGTGTETPENLWSTVATVTVCGGTLSLAVGGAVYYYKYHYPGRANKQKVQTKTNTAIVQEESKQRPDSVTLVPRLIEERKLVEARGNPPEPLQESLTGWQADQAELQKMADAARESPRHQALINQLTYLFTSTSDSAVERRNKQLMITFIVLVSVQMMLTSYIGFRFRYSPTGSMDDLNSPMNMQRVVFPILAIGSTLMIAKAVLELTPRQPSAIKDDTPQTAPESDRNHDPLSFQSPIRAHANNGPHDLPAGEMTSTRQDDAAAKSVDEVLSDCDRLHEQQQCEEEEKNLRRLLNRTSDSKLLAEIEWRIGRASNSRANLMCRNGGGPSKESKQDRESRIAVIREGYDHVVKAIELNDECSEAHKWAAILLAQYGGSLHESIKNAHKIREYGKRSVELNPEDPQSHYILGAWAYEVSKVGWMERKIATTIFGEPPQASLEEALEYFEKAENLKSGFWMVNHLKIAQVMHMLNRKDEAKEWLRKAQELPHTLDEDRWGAEERESLSKKIN